MTISSEFAILFRLGMLTVHLHIANHRSTEMRLYFNPNLENLQVPDPVGGSIFVFNLSKPLLG